MRRTSRNTATTAGAVRAPSAAHCITASCRIRVIDLAVPVVGRVRRARRPALIAFARVCSRVEAPSFAYRSQRDLTVLGETNRREAISLRRSVSARQLSTSRSRAVSADAGGLGHVRSGRDPGKVVFEQSGGLLAA